MACSRETRTRPAGALHSALGHHDDPSRALAFDQSAQWIAYRTNHIQLLSSPQVTQQLLQWLAPRPLPVAPAGS